MPKYRRYFSGIRTHPNLLAVHSAEPLKPSFWLRDLLAPQCTIPPESRRIPISRGERSCAKGRPSRTRFSMHPSFCKACQHGPDALCSPSVSQLIALLASLCSTGLWKLGSCFERLLDTRTHDAAHYNPMYFNRDGAICVAYGIASTK